MTASRLALGALAAAIERNQHPGARAAALGRQLAGTLRGATRFDDIVAAPAWLGWSAADRLRLGRHAALAAMSPQLAASVDGRWLGGLAKIAGDDVLDWARTQATAGPSVAAFAAADLDEVASSALRGALPISLRDLVAPPARDFGVPDGALALALAQCST